MQREPEKLLGNYNEIQGAVERPPIIHDGFRILKSQEQCAAQPEEVVLTGVELVNDKIDQLLGKGNKLTSQGLDYPDVHFISSSAKHPGWAAWFSPSLNRMTLVTGTIGDSLPKQIKVFGHEYVHYLSHNAKDDTEKATGASPLSQNNNVGFHRDFGLDIRKGREGRKTSDYFLAFNEATTEQFMRDALPGVYETYPDYVELLNQFMDDAVEKGIGSKNQFHTFEEWPRERFKDYIYTLFFQGNLNGFTVLLKNVYDEYDISEQQFGLMTHKNDLPSLIKKKLSKPGSPPPSPADVTTALQMQLDSKTEDDYITDVFITEPGDENETKYGEEYDAMVDTGGIKHSITQTINSKVYNFDNQGYIIYAGEDAKARFSVIKSELDNMVAQQANPEEVAMRIDELLFSKHHVSMLSEGFRDFYIYKHSQLDKLR